MNDIERILDGVKNMPSIIENATVYTKRIRDDGRGGGETEYYGKDRKWVVNEALSTLHTIDPYKSPSMGKAYQHDGYWHVNVKWFGLGG